MKPFQWLKNTYAWGQQSVIRIPDGPRTPAVRRRLCFSGLVQGVGFRYEAKLLAERLELVGWVRNRSDGAVEMEIEGPAGCIDAFLQAIQAVPRFDITEIQSEELPVRGAETTLQIRF